MRVWDEDVTGHPAASSAGAMLQPIRSGACQAGGSTTTVNSTPARRHLYDYYNKMQIVGWVTADGTNRFADFILDYNGTTKVATVTGIPVSPDASYTYAILPGGTIPGASAPTAGEVADAVWDEAIAGHTTEATYGAWPKVNIAWAIAIPEKMRSVSRRRRPSGTHSNRLPRIWRA